ncbi:MAG: Na(+)-translocating NADH-quinone reductase subunit A [Granulosicoccaceae bacterium]
MQGKTFSLTKGLDVPIEGAPNQAIESGAAVPSVALLGRDYHGLKPTMAVQQGDKVVAGQLLFTDKRNPGVNFTSPGAGTVTAIHRGARRALQAVEIELDGSDSAEDFGAVAASDMAGLSAEQVREKLIQSGQWTALRTRPYSKVPAVDGEAAALFVTAIDTRPLAADPAVVLADQAEAFEAGLQLLAKLAPKCYVCVGADSKVPQPAISGVEYHRFEGPHPAGLAGTHVSLLEPVSQTKQVWVIGYQDVVAVAKLFETGKLWTDRVVALAGPMVKQPRLLRTRLGASTEALVANELDSGAVRVVSGSVLDGFNAQGSSAWLGRYSQQLCALADGQSRQMFHWVNPLLKQFSSLNVFLGAKPSTFPMTTTQNGSRRAMVPIGSYERVVPTDVLITQLLRSLLVRDTDEAQKLGCLDMDEEDLALCTFVCHSKYEYGEALRASLEQIEREG